MHSMQRWKSGIAILLSIGLINLADNPQGRCADDVPRAQCARYDVRQFGARGDGTSLDTTAIQKAIDTASGSGGGTVCLAGGTFLSGTIRLKDNVTLYIEAGAVLRGSRSIEDYPDFTPQIAYLYRPRFTKSLIYAEGAENIAIGGRGTIDGQGEHFPAKPGDDKGRPYLVRFSQCKKVRVRDVTFRNSARWLSHYLACDDVIIDGITIESLIRENRDGIDIDSCNGVVVSNCHIVTGDDAIVLKATAMRPCRRVAITNCIVSSKASALKLGTESCGGFEDITITNCTIYDTGYSGIALMTVDGGTLDRVSISNITMTNVRVPIFVRLGNRGRTLPGRPPPGPGALRNVVISNVQASGAGQIGCSITGIPGHDVENLTLQNVRIRFHGGGTRDDAARNVPEKESAYPSGRMFGRLPAWGLYCRHVRNLRLHNVDLALQQHDARPAVVCDDVHRLHVFSLRVGGPGAAETLLRLRNVRGAIISGCSSESRAGTFLRVEGDGSAEILVSGNQLGNVERAVSLGGQVPREAVTSER